MGKALWKGFRNCYRRKAGLNNREEITMLSSMKRIGGEKLKI